MELVLGATLMFAAVLLVASLSGFLSEKSGIINIGIEGMMTFGALFFVIFGNVFHGYEENNWWTFVPALICGGLMAAAFALLHGVATIIFKAEHVISGTAINMLGVGIAIFIVYTTARDFSHNVSPSAFTTIYANKVIGESYIQRLNLIYFLMAIVIAGTIFTYFKSTRFGLRYAAVGENPNAADSATIKVNRYKWWAVCCSGMLAGVAGGFVTSQIGAFSGSVNGLGFLALAILILGQWQVMLIVPAAILFAFIYSLADAYFFTQLPQEVLFIMPFALSLITLIGLSRFERAPRALGTNFDRSRR